MLSEERRALYEQYKRERDATRAVAKSTLTAVETTMVAAATARMRQSGFTLCEYRSHFTYHGILRAFSYESNPNCFGHPKYEFEMKP